MQNTTFSATKRSLLALVTTIAITGCATSPAPITVVDKISSTPALSTFNNLMGKTDLADALRGNGPFTVFAPSNEAFKALPAATLQDLSSNPQKLKDVLSYHVATGKALKAEDAQTSKLNALNGAHLALSKAGDFVIIENAAVTQVDITASNGVVHVIDAVMLPPAKK